MVNVAKLEAKSRYDPPEDITTSHHGGDPESEAAHEAIRPLKERLRQRVFSRIKNRGAYGATSHEIESALGLSHQSCSPRFTELKKAGLIVKNGQRRKPVGAIASSAVYVSADWA